MLLFSQGVKRTNVLKLQFGTLFIIHVRFRSKFPWNVQEGQNLPQHPQTKHPKKTYLTSIDSSFGANPLLHLISGSEAVWEYDSVTDWPTDSQEGRDATYVSRKVKKVLYDQCVSYLINIPNHPHITAFITCMLVNVNHVQMGLQRCQDKRSTHFVGVKELGWMNI